MTGEIMTETTMTTRYAKTETAAEFIDCDPTFLKKRMDEDFIEGIHFFRPANCRMVRWDLKALEEWMRGSSPSLSHENNLILSQLLA